MVIFYKESEDEVPVLKWLDEIRKKDKKAWARCYAKIELLDELGHELRRPHADSIGDGLYELRIKKGRVNYRILYSFHGQELIPLLHGFTKESILPPAEIQRALERKKKFDEDPEKHTHQE